MFLPRFVTKTVGAYQRDAKGLEFFSTDSGRVLPVEPSVNLPVGEYGRAAWSATDDGHEEREAKHYDDDGSHAGTEPV